MPGTPNPVLGSDALTAAVSLLAAAVAVVLAVRSRDAASPRVLALGGGVGYAVLAVGLWFVVRLVAGQFSQYSASAAEWVGIVLLSAAVVALHAGLALYLHARWRYLTPLAALFAVTALLAWLFLRVGGETDPLVIYAILFGPAVPLFFLALAAAEYGVRVVVG
ncbi:hypothetical protein NDI76_08090 [Halogeometricum sp. S1BR25-6]|uniref:Histidine kinase N-terminal 7TM region domain-containing protein n=1 Tax=Halogeometricum salsisoli TaxID=2950536 RepID=A0ABU2GD04_9EURY|nr:hypothetical protein [Halogeometricum sp. S1BR25-6]MDS0298700.1 hypothetical protein [Halogeometricum sp. S1BR25-6]